MSVALAVAVIVSTIMGLASTAQMGNHIRNWSAPGTRPKLIIHCSTLVMSMLMLARSLILGEIVNLYTPDSIYVLDLLHEMMGVVVGLYILNLIKNAILSSNQQQTQSFSKVFGKLIFVEAILLSTSLGLVITTRQKRYDAIRAFSLTVVSMISAGMFSWSTWTIRKRLLTLHNSIYSQYQAKLGNSATLEFSKRQSSSKLTKQPETPSSIESGARICIKHERLDVGCTGSQSFTTSSQLRAKTAQTSVHFGSHAKVLPGSIFGSSQSSQGPFSSSARSSRASSNFLTIQTLPQCQTQSGRLLMVRATSIPPVAEDLKDELKRSKRISLGKVLDLQGISRMTTPRKLEVPLGAEVRKAKKLTRRLAYLMVFSIAVGFIVGGITVFYGVASCRSKDKISVALLNRHPLIYISCMAFLQGFFIYYAWSPFRGQLNKRKSQTGNIT